MAVTDGTMVLVTRGTSGGHNQVVNVTEILRECLSYVSVIPKQIKMKQRFIWELALPED